MRFDQAFDDQAVLAELGARLARYRLNRNMKQEGLAEQAGVSRATVARMEKGSPTSLTNLVRILRALNLLENLDALLPELPLSPIQQLRTKKRQRQRASTRAEPDVATGTATGAATGTATGTATGAPVTNGGPGEPAPWTWGDDP